MTNQTTNNWSNDNEVSLWTEKYRPKKIDDCVIPRMREAEIKEMISNKDIPNLLFYGSAGIGKTTIAEVMCLEMNCDYMVLNGSDIGGDFAKFKHTISTFATTMSLFNKKKVVIVDEADNMANSSEMFLRRTMEEYAKNCRFIFTCNHINKIIPAIHSRCAKYRFDITERDYESIKDKFVSRACEILNIENISHASKTIEELVVKKFPDFRSVLNELQKHSVVGEIDNSILGNQDNVSMKLMFQTLKTNRFDSVRQWCGTHYRDMAPVDFYRSLYDVIDDYVDKSNRPEVAVILNDYSFKSSMVQDQEMNMTACLLSLMKVMNN
jgi:DNA polymerase III delta prime subunit